MSARLSACVCTAIALHAGAIASLAREVRDSRLAAPHAQAAADAAARPARALTVRLLEQPPGPVALAAPALASGPAEARGTQPAPDLAGPADRQAFADDRRAPSDPVTPPDARTAALDATLNVEPGGTAQTAQTSEGAQTAGPVVPAAPAGVSGRAEDGYVARPQLTTAPEALADIALPFPLDFRERGRFAGILTLYIEADGRVSRVVVEGASLPPPLARVAQEAFARARFTPGRVQARIVKSRIRVEVVFDNAAV